MKKFLFILLFASLQGFSQNQPIDYDLIDSLKAITESDAHDTIRIEAYHIWDDMIYIEDPELDLEINQIVYDISKENLLSKKLSPREVRIYIGCMARSLNVIGLINTDQANYLEAQENFHQSLKYAEYIKDSAQISGPLNNLGMIYNLQGFSEKSLYYYEKAMEIDGDSDPMSKGIYLNNIGQCYADLNNEKLALNFFRQSLVLSRDNNDLSNYSDALVNIGNIYLSDNNNLDSALHYYEMALAVCDSINYVGLQAVCLSKIGTIHLLKNDPQKALTYCNTSLSLLADENSPAKEKYCQECLYLSYKELNNTSKALIHLERLIVLRKELKDQATLDELMTAQFNFKYEKKQISDSLAMASIQRIREVQLQADIKSKNTIQYVLYAGIGGLILIAIVLYRNFKLKQKDNEIIAAQKRIVEDQKHLVEEKNQEITDSITYAKRLQEAILPSRDKISMLLPESFVLYLPKDIVAGDFYWLEESGNKVLFAIADCTGHGVPGALVSVVCNNSLNRAVREFKLTQPAEILNKTRELVIETFKSSSTTVKDGMDIALCCFDLKSRQLEYAGANNSLYLLNSEEFKEIKADKQPIGTYTNPTPFTNHIVEIENGDELFLFTDGFADQFGGEKGKKYKYKPFKEFLINLSGMSAVKQKAALENEFSRWLGDYEQIDDVCIMGVQFKKP